ncbi:MAG: YceI family protein [Gemmatimonadaceae bacterium]|nr:YceI family protein [Chitinophagaceae bacterium]
MSKYLMLLLSILSFSPVVFSQAVNTNFGLDSSKSQLFWKSNKKIGSGHYGTIQFSFGKIVVSANGSILGGTFILDMNTINSTEKISENGRKEVNGVIKSDEFFYVKRFTAGVMTLKSVTPISGDYQYTVTGELTVKNITKPVTFVATITKNGDAMFSKASFKIDRRLWHIGFKPEVLFGEIKDDMIEYLIDIELDLTFSRQ